MFNVQEPTVRDIAFVGKGDIKFLVDGLEQWRDPASFTLEIRRESSRDWDPEKREVSWTYKVSSLGYSITATSKNAWSNYAEALKAAGEKIQMFMKMEDQMESIFQEGEAHRAEEARREEEERKAKRDADKPVGKVLARKLIETMKREVKTMGRWDTQNIKCFERGTRRDFIIKVEFSRSGMGLFSKDYTRISKDKAIALLADSHLQSLDVSGCPALPDPNVAAFLLMKS
jgi:hypothetical protein